MSDIASDSTANTIEFVVESIHQDSVIWYDGSNRYWKIKVIVQSEEDTDEEMEAKGLIRFIPFILHSGKALPGDLGDSCFWLPKDENLWEQTLERKK